MSVVTASVMLATVYSVACCAGGSLSLVCVAPDDTVAGSSVSVVLASCCTSTLLRCYKVELYVMYFAVGEPCLVL